MKTVALWKQHLSVAPGSVRKTKVLTEHLKLQIIINYYLEFWTPILTDSYLILYIIKILLTYLRLSHNLMDSYMNNGF